MKTEEKFELWCVVELFGHQKIAGLCTEQNIAGTNMLRVDVPENDKNGAFTKFYGGSAIYAINPVDEVVARETAKHLQVSPVNVFSLETYLDKVNSSKQLAEHHAECDEDDLPW